MVVPAIIELGWSLLGEVVLGVGTNELHRQLVDRLQRRGAAGFSLQRELHNCLLRAIDTLVKYLSSENHPYFQRISDPQGRHDERQRVKEILRAIRSRFPETGTLLQGPVELLLEDKTPADVRILYDKLGLESDLASLPEMLRHNFEANLPLVMLAHFRQQVATDQRLSALLQLDMTTVGFQAVRDELHAISTFLRQHCGSDDPTEIKAWSENLVTEWKDFIAKELAQIERKVDELPDRIREIILEIYDRLATRHLSPGFYRTRGPSTWSGDSLPYHQLGGPGLERLCYLLLLDQGRVPRYFGEPGQGRYSIDLLVTHDEGTVVYQCRNVGSLSLAGMKRVLQHFETEWIGRPELPTPTEFVLCCPLPLQEHEHNKAWTKFEREFRARTSVSVQFWDRRYLDERLKHLPDVVADLFSDQIAEQFCDLHDWNSDLFRPLVYGCGEKIVDCYLELKEQERLYLDPEIKDAFTQKLAQNDSLLLQGLPGTGKTITGLALAESLSYRHKPYRVFYVDLTLPLTAL